MNRNEEYNALLRELEQTPPELDGTVDRARARLRRRRAGRWCGIPAASLAGVAAAFVLLVNYSMPFAQACSTVPVLRELMAAVAFSPSLKLAVEHNYAQYIGEEQTQNGVTLRLEYLILDQGQLQFFLKASGPWDSYQAHPTLTDGDGVPVEGNVISSTIFDPDELVGAASVHVLGDSFRFPNVLRITFHLTGESHSGQAPASALGDEEETAPAYEGDFSFEIPLDASHLNEVMSIPMGDWVEVDGQRLRFALDSYPTHGRLTVEEHPDNTASLAGLDFYLEDEKGNRYEAGARSGSSGRLVASGADGVNEVIYYYLESSFFRHPERLTLYLTGAEWLDKDAEWITVDLTTGAASWLPEGVEFRSIDRRGEDVHCVVDTPDAGALFTWDYRDPEGGEHRWESMSMTVRASEPVEEDLETEPHEISFTLEDYPWDTVELKLRASRETELAEPVAVALP